nr:T9SS type A sorting domain-containing protein [uncultured Dyadobacter sp.]
MTKIWVGIAMLAGVLMPQLLRAQNVTLNINAAQPTILNGETGFLDVYLCNTDALNIPVPADRIRVLASFPTNLVIEGITNEDGTPASDFTVLFLNNDDTEGAHDIKVQYKPALPNGNCVIYRIRVRGKGVGTGPILASLSFALPINNSTADDNSSSSIPVEVNLPVTLREFNAERQENSAFLSWSTTEETNSDRFDVQRSANGKDWTTIQTVQAAGESNLTREYSAVDKKPMDGENLYRLKMIDRDSSTAFSSVRSLKFEGAPTKLYPNPVTDFLHLESGDWEAVSAVTIYDVTGRAVYKSRAKPESTIDIRSLSPGVYHVKVRKANGAENSYRIAIAK